MFNYCRIVLKVVGRLFISIPLVKESSSHSTGFSVSTVYDCHNQRSLASNAKPCVDFVVKLHKEIVGTQ